MKQISIRCWKTQGQCESGEAIDTYFTVPDFGDSYNLFTCLKCSAIFAVDPNKEFYSGIPFNELKQNLQCPVCGESLDSIVPYPDTYICPQTKGRGSLMRMERTIPPDNLSIIYDFWDPYSEVILE